MDKNIIFNLYLDNELVGGGMACLTDDNRIVRMGGPFGLIVPAPMEPFQEGFVGYVRTEDTGEEREYNGGMSKVVNVYTLSPKRFELHQRQKMGGSRPEVLPF